MTTYKKTVVIDDPNQLVLSDLPFQVGERVKVIILTQNYEPSPNGERLRSLLKKTQSLPSSQAITEEEIAAEIEAYRRGE